MKVIYIKMKTLYKLSITVVLIVVLILTICFFIQRDATETFKFRDVYYKGNVNSKRIAFTCNVDWGNEHIPPMLEVFREENIKITFFVTGRWADKNPELLKKISEAGHEIGNHGYAHKDYSTMGYDDNIKQIYDTDKIITHITGVKPKYFAPPAGAYNDYTLQAARKLNYEVIMWSIDTIDWRKDSTMDKIINRVVSKIHNSAIILMHPKPETIKALPHIISTLNNKGYKVGKVSDIIE